MIKVIHVIGNLRLGGGQKITYAVVRGLDRSRFRASACCLEEGGHYAALLRDEDIPVVEMGFPKDYSAAGLLRGPRLFGRLVHLFRSQRPHIVHTHLFGAGLVGRLAAQIAGVPVIVTTLHRIFYPQIQPLVERALLPLTDCVVVDSDAVKGLLQKECKVAGNKVRVIYNGIDPGELSNWIERVDARRRLLLPVGVCDPSAKVIGIVAHLAPHKGQRYMIEALPHVHRNGVSAHLLLVGDGPDRPVLEEKARALGLSEYVHFAGYRSDMNLVLSALDMLALPSSWEGFGLILAEGMFKRLPVVSTDTGGATEVVAQFSSGLLTPFADIRRLVDATTLILKNPALAKSMGEAGFRRADETFTVKTMIAAYQNVYFELLQKGRQVPVRL
jgi:glycosyltransferase involved in cell wall biosynthesis